MNKLFTIAIVLTALFAAAGCSQENEILPSQQKQTVAFLTTKHDPRLISEEQIADEGPLPYYSVSGNSVYRYIFDVWNPARDGRTEVTASSTVTITYRAYVFNYTTIPFELSATSLPFDSNDPEIEADMYDKWGLTPGRWSFEPMVIQLGRTEILKGLRLALIGCREGDIVEAYMTYNMAYGSNNFNIIPRDTPVAYFFTVNSVN